MSAHSVEVVGRTFEHKDTLKTSFKLWWKGESWKGKYRVGSPLLPRLISYCAKNKLRLLVDGESTASEATESEFDYQSDYEQQTIQHKTVKGGGHPLQGFSLPVETKALGFVTEPVKPSETVSDWGQFQSVAWNRYALQRGSPRTTTSFTAYHGKTSRRLQEYHCRMPYRFR